MRESPLRLIKQFAEFRTMAEVKLVPRGRRGLYVLYQWSESDGKEHYDVVYVGMATKGIRGRLESHVKSPKKAVHWTHFSAFEVWDNIRDEEIRELEGLFRHIYKFDSQASPLNAARGFKAIRAIPKLDLPPAIEIIPCKRGRRPD